MSGIYSGTKVEVVAKELNGGQQSTALTRTAWEGETYEPVERSGSADTTNAEAQVLRLTERSLSLEKNLLETEEIRSSRMQADVRHGFTTATATLGFEIASPPDTPAGTAPYDGGQKMLIQSVLENADAGASVGTPTGTAAAGYNSLSGDGASFGDVLYQDGNAQVVVSNSYNATSGLICEDGGNAALAGSTTYRAEAMTIGNGTPRAYVLDRVFKPDTGTTFTAEPFVNCVGNSLNVSISPEAIATGSVEFLATASLGMVDDTEADARFFDSPTAANSTPVYAAFDGAILEGGGTTPLGIVTSIEFTVNNNRTTEARIGSKFSDCVFDATCQVEGTMTVFFNGSTQYNKFVDETASRLVVVLRDPNNGGALLAISCPNIKYNGGTIDPPQEGPVTMEMPFRALEGDNGESAIKIVNVNYSA
jgi:hypothetical protein